MSGRRAAVAAIAVATLLAACGAVPAGPASAGRATSGPTTGPTSAGPAGNPPAATATTAASSAPSAFVDAAENLSIVRASATTAYLLRTASADGNRVLSTSLLRTTEAGAHVVRVTSPAAHDQVTLVFTGATTGYALVGDPWPHGSATTSVQVTTDGARTWHRVTLPTGDPVIALAGHGGRVFAVTTHCTGPTTCDRVRLWTSPAGRTALQAARVTVPARDASSGVTLDAWEDTVLLTVGLDGPHPVLVRSTDAGRTGTARRPGSAALACDATASSAHVVWNACRTGMMMAFSRSVDGREHPLPLEAAGTIGAFLEPVSDEVAWFGVGLGDEAGRFPAGLYRTTDAGRHFTRVSPGPPGYSSNSAVTFLDATHALVADGVHVVRTADGARTWLPVGLPEEPPVSAPS